MVNPTRQDLFRRDAIKVWEKTRWVSADVITETGGNLFIHDMLTLKQNILMQLFWRQLLVAGAG